MNGWQGLTFTDNPTTRRPTQRHLPWFGLLFVLAAGFNSLVHLPDRITRAWTWTPTGARFMPLRIRVFLDFAAKALRENEIINELDR